MERKEPAEEVKLLQQASLLFVLVLLLAVLVEVTDTTDSQQLSSVWSSYTWTRPLPTLGKLGVALEHWSTAQSQFRLKQTTFFTPNTIFRNFLNEFFSRRFSREKCPTLRVASFFHLFLSDYNLTLIGPLFLQSKLLKLLP